MNREILFKAKAKDSAEWIEGGLIVVKNTTRRFIVDINSKTALRGVVTHCSDKYDWRSTEVYPDTVCQFTGITTELGIYLYENDIVECCGYRGVIKFEDGAFVIEWIGNGTEFLRKDLAYWANLDGFQTIGNIYDNPELLEEEDVHGRFDQNH